MRTVALAHGYAAAFVLAAGLLAAGTRLLDSSWLPGSPGGNGWTGVAAMALLAVAAVAIVRRPLLAGSLALLSGMLHVAAKRGDHGLAMLVWAAAYAGFIALAGRLYAERRAATTRSAIHRRIDEELIDLSRDA